MPPRRRPQTESARAARRADRSLSIPELAQLSGAPVATVEGWRATYPAPPRDSALALEEQRAVLLQIAARLGYHVEAGEKQPEDGWKSAVADHLGCSRQRVAEVWGGAIVRPSTLRRWLSVL